MRNVKEAASSRMKAYMNMEDIEGFLLDLSYKDHYQLITFSRMTTHLQAMGGKKNE
mgnify:CR=1 FL=1